MPSTIACPSCRRALTLPAEAMNRLVQCPACKQQFHPAEAESAAVRANLPKVDLSAPKPEAAPTGASGGQGPSRVPPPPPPPVDDLPRRSRRKRPEYDVCPKCRARVQRNADRCAECGVEFEAEKDEDDRPWERSGEERRDSEPHRGGLILTLGLASILLPMVSWCPVVGLIATVVGLCVGVAAVAMGRSDLRKIDQHIIALEGRGTTQSGVICGIIGIVLNVLAVFAAVWITVQWLM